ncbi:MAG: hypothetical protein GDA54_03380 [Alphaproteobacteria bacterium GM7ARS4]|nr:hypothetical protein [Alphaproteobacteria bacterium GM7ARS4]
MLDTLLMPLLHAIPHAPQSAQEIEAYLQNPSTWTTVAFVIFVIIAFRPLKKAFTNILNNYSEKIAQDIHEAVQLAYEARTALDDITDKYEKAVQQTNKTLQDAQEKAQQYRQEAQAQTDMLIAQQKKLAQARRHTLEQNALNAVRSHSVHTALHATRLILATKLSPQHHQTSLTNALSQLKKQRWTDHKRSKH